jgi:tetratricopeptide (TPR) repeat protein
VLAKAVQIAPNHAPAWLDYGRALFSNKQYAEALKAATQAAQQHTDEAYQAMVLSGEILLVVGEERKAMDYARDAERIAPMEPEPRLLNCKILVARGKDKDALAALNKAIDDLPGVLALETERARLVYKLQGAEAAVQVLQPLAESHPENDQVISTYAAALAECGQTAEAEKAALLALRLNPQKAEIHLLLGRLFADSGQLDKSVHHLSESARISPNQADAYLDLGRVYTTRRDFPEALEAYQQAIRTSPEDFRPFYQAGLILRDGKDYQAAETMLRRAATLAPSDVNIRRQLGAIVALNLVHNCQEANSCL